MSEWSTKCNSEIHLVDTFRCSNWYAETNNAIERDSV